MLIIGDVHGKFEEYHKIINNYTKNESIQLGDFGYWNEWNLLRKCGSGHKIIPGNHDDYDVCFNNPHCLGDFGVYKDYFFIRGGISIDRTYRDAERIKGGPATYFPSEELNFTQMMECMELYKKQKPSIVLSHAGPAHITNQIMQHNNFPQKFGFPKGWNENTSLFMDHLLKIHKPKLWIFGHLHRSRTILEGNTTFKCLAELETYEIAN